MMIARVRSVNCIVRPAATYIPTTEDEFHIPNHKLQYHLHTSVDKHFTISPKSSVLAIKRDELIQESILHFPWGPFL